MNLSKRARYALHAAMDMVSAEGEAVSVAQVAERYGIPEGALAKVLQRLVRSGLAVGTRGIGGGYRLARPPSEITVLDVIQALERSPKGGRCLGSDRPGAACQGTGPCRLRKLFEEVDDLVRYTFQSVSLETLVRPSRVLSVQLDPGPVADAPESLAIPERGGS